MDQIQNTEIANPPDGLNEFYSVEVTMEEMCLPYQFKLWRSDHNSLFLLIKENSALLPRLKVGNIMPLKYYGSNAHSHSEIKQTQIQKIINEKQGRFKGHHRVELTIIAKDSLISAN